MPRRKEVERLVESQKECWHLYGLQPLAPQKFALVVGRILKGQYAVVNTRFMRPQAQ